MPARLGRQGVLYVAALTAVAAGVVVLVVVLMAQTSAPQPSAADRGRISVPPLTVAGATSRSPGSDPSPAPSSSTPPKAEPALTLPASSPASIDIPAIGVSSSIVFVGKNPDGTLAVPQPGPDLNKVAWYQGSPTPGQAGPSVLEGHVDTVYGPSVFYRLGALSPGDTISVTRTDHTTAVFTVNAVRSYATHDQFPASQIFAGDIADPTLRLITCSNFDEQTGHYIGNTIVFAHLTGVRHG